MGKTSDWKKELPADILAKVGRALQGEFGEIAEQAAAVRGVIQRRRKFTALSLAQTFVLGFLLKPNASDEDLARLAAQCGVDVTPQAIDHRHSPKLETFPRELFVRAARLVIGSDRVLAPLLERFTKVIVLDSSTITLPDEREPDFAGCGGSYEGGKAAMKLQTELDLRGGAVTHVEVEQGRSPDGATTRQ